MVGFLGQPEIYVPGEKPVVQAARPAEYCDDVLRPDQPNRYLQIVSQMARKHRLLSVHWELTYRCNDKCTYCYLDVFSPNASVPGELTTEQCKQTLDQLAALNAFNITFSGGEI